MTNAFEHIDYHGHTLDRLTLAAFNHGADILKVISNATTEPGMSQGSYTSAFGPSGGTHAGSGAFDLDPPPPGASYADMQRAYRWAGVAAWHRPAGWDNGDGIEHQHNIVIGDTGVSPTARAQVFDYHAGLNGLANHAADPTWRPNPILAFRYPLAQVSLSRVVEQATGHPTTASSIIAVRHVQRCLNLKRQAGLAVDGVYGPMTRAAYKRWEHQVGATGTAVDGIPSQRALVLLGASRFTVVA